MLLAEYASTNYGEDITLASSGANNQLAQGFKVKRACSVGRVYVYASLTGTPGGYLYVQIQGDTSSVPSGTAIDNGTSGTIAASAISAGMNAFDFDIDSRPQLLPSVQYHLVIRSGGGYTADSTNYVAIGADQDNPHYLNGAGSTFNAAWTAIATATDFPFQAYSGTRATIYSNIREIESLTRHLTDNGKYTHTSTPTATDVMDFEDTVSQMIDGWLSAASITVPLTASAAQSMVKMGANYCVVMNVEMTQRTAGFKAQESDTRAGAARALCYALQKDVTTGALKDAVRGAQDGADATGAGALTSGQISSSERDERKDDTSLVQPIFSTGMWSH